MANIGFCFAQCAHLPVVDVLKGLTVILVFQEGDYLLQRIARSGAHTQMIAFDLYFDLELCPFDIFIYITAKPVIDVYINCTIYQCIMCKSFLKRIEKN